MRGHRPLKVSVRTCSTQVFSKPSPFNIVRAMGKTIEHMEPCLPVNFFFPFASTPGRGFEPVQRPPACFTFSSSTFCTSTSRLSHPLLTSMMEDQSSPSIYNASVRAIERKVTTRAAPSPSAPTPSTLCSLAGEQTMGSQSIFAYFILFLLGPSTRENYQNERKFPPSHQRYAETAREKRDFLNSLTTQGLSLNPGKSESRRHLRQECCQQCGFWRQQGRFKFYFFQSSLLDQRHVKQNLSAADSLTPPLDASPQQPLSFPYMKNQHPMSSR